MDLNYLYQRHGISLLMAQNAGCERSRDAHLALMAAYAARIAEAKSERPRIGMFA